MAWPALYDSMSMPIKVYVVGFMVLLFAVYIEQGQSPLKKLLGLKTVRLDGSEISASQGLRRETLKLAPFLATATISYALFGVPEYLVIPLALYTLYVGWCRGGVFFYERMSRTRVVAFDWPEDSLKWAKLFQRKR